MKPKKITEVWAWVCEEEDGGEGIPAFSGANGLMLPLVMADKARMDSMENVARALQKIHQRPFKLIRFHQMEVIERVE